jgi:hypothetical protein
MKQPSSLTVSSIDLMYSMRQGAQTLRLNSAIKTCPFLDPDIPDQIGTCSGF